MTNYYIWTEHLTTNNNENITLLNYQTTNNKGINGIELVYELSGNTHPIWDLTDQIIYTPRYLSSDVGSWKYKIVQPSIGNNLTGKIVLAGNTSQKIKSNNRISCLAIFKNTKFIVKEVNSLAEGINSININNITIQIPENSIDDINVSYSYIPIDKADVFRSYTQWKNAKAYAALKSDRSVVTWGDADNGGNSDNVTLNFVNRIFSNYYSFAALNMDKTVTVWGNNQYGGSVNSNIQSLLINIRTISSTEKAYAAIDISNNVITWGDQTNGGNSSSVSNQLTNVKQVYSNKFAFAALKYDKTVVAWGNTNYGGTIPANIATLLTDVKEIFSTFYSFGALRNDGRVITWGHSSYGGL